MADTRRVMNCQLGSLAAAAAAGWGQTIVLILPGGDTHQHNHQRQL